MKIERSRVTTIILLAISALSIYGVYLVFQPFYKSILWAIIIGVTFWPVYIWTRKTLGGRASLSSLIVVTGVILFFLIPSIMVMTSLVTQLSFAYDAVQPHLPEIMEKVSYLLPLKNEALKETIINNIKDIGNVIITYLSSATGNILSIIFQFTGTVLILYFIFKDGESLLENIKGAALIPHRDLEVFIRETGEVITAVIYGVIITAMVQGLLGGIGFWIVGLPAPVLFGTIMFILALIPFGGTAMVWLPAAIWLFYKGMTWQGIFLMLWGVVVISMIDNFLKPYFIGKRLGFHGLLTFIGLVGGMMVFGFLGVFLGPLLLAISIRLFEMYLKIET